MNDLLLIGEATDDMVNRLSQRFKIHILDELPEPLTWLRENGQKIYYVATNGHDGVRSEHVDAMPNLKLISCYGVGYDAIDIKQAVARGIIVTHTPNVLNAEVATTALLVLLACYRNLLGNDAYIREGKWKLRVTQPLRVQLTTKQLAFWAWVALVRQLWINYLHSIRVFYIIQDILSRLNINTMQI